MWVDGAMPFRGETIRGYVQGAHRDYLAASRARAPGAAPAAARHPRDPLPLQPGLLSIDAMVPAVISLLLLFVPAMLTALGVVREKELGSITNLYVTPVTRLEFLLGKQLPYVALAMLSFCSSWSLAVFVVRRAASRAASSRSRSAPCSTWSATTASASSSRRFTRARRSPRCSAPPSPPSRRATPFSGLTDPVSSLEGAGRAVGQRLSRHLLHHASPRRVPQGPRVRGAPAGEFLALAAFVPARDRPDRRACCGSRTDSVGDGAATILRLGVKELRSLWHDTVLLGLRRCARSRFGIYTAASHLHVPRAAQRRHRRGRRGPLAPVPADHRRLLPAVLQDARPHRPRRRRSRPRHRALHVRAGHSPQLPAGCPGGAAARPSRSTSTPPR